jgi:hypothetical protein
MRSHKKITLTVLTALVVSLVSLVTLSGRGQNRANARKSSVVVLRRQDQLATPPTRREIAEAKQAPADYAAQEPADPAKRAGLRARSKRYDRQGMVTPPNPRAGGTETKRIAGWLRKLPALPVETSDAVVIGEVTDAQSHLSNDKTGVYTEFTVLVGEVLKNQSAAPLAPSAALTVQRDGGRVLFPSGSVHSYSFHFQGMPAAGRQYVLFLKRNEDGETFYVRTAYELRAGRVFPVDGVDLPPGATELPQFASYKGADQAAFLGEVRAAISAASAANRGR